MTRTAAVASDALEEVERRAILLVHQVQERATHELAGDPSMKTPSYSEQWIWSER